VATLTLPTRDATRYTSSAAAVRAQAWHAYAVVVAAVCVMTGVYWDISWHMSIGRDSFWTPAHLLIQTGGLIAGASSGYVALKTTFAGTESDRAATVSYWGFRAPLGAWVCVWGCLAMLTSAPFDNWWHDAYGLDVKIVSPPHTVLALGIFSIVLGALLLTLAKQNRSEGEERRRFSRLYIVSAGMLLMNFAIFLTEYSDRVDQHGGEFYRVSAIFYPFALVATARGSTHRWAATRTAAVYMGIMLGLMWIVQLLPATPKLGPIYQPITHMVGMAFPLWLIVPGIAIDLVRRRFDGRLPTPVLAVSLAAAFLVAFLAVQWPFSSFMVESSAARNWLFNADNFVYWASPTYVQAIRHFPPLDTSGLLRDLGVALLYASISAYIGLLWGRWMTKVQR
jgi:hypothetical protein